jgi:CheY-like chemotaxis protein
MAAFLTCELAPTEVASSDRINRKRLLCRKASTRGRVSRVGHVCASRRVLRVLVVDDEQDTTDGLVKLLCRWGHAARKAYDGLAALRVAADQHPDVVLLDLELPLMDGCQVAKQLRLNFSREECFIIAVAGRADDKRRQQCLEAGIDLLLIKPVDPEVMETLLLLECVRMNRLQRQSVVADCSRAAAATRAFGRCDGSLDHNFVKAVHFYENSTSLAARGRYSSGGSV